MEDSLRDIVELMSKPDGWEIASVIAGITGTIIAVVAIFMNIASIKAQNKQSLFEKRLENYLLCKTFYELIDQNQEHLIFEKEANYPLAVNLEFLWITNASYFGESPKIIYDVDKEDLRREFLKNIENLNLIAEKIALLFNNENGKLMAKFIERYSKTLRSMYGYQVLLDRMENDHFNKELKNAYSIGIVPDAKMKTPKQLCKEYGENKIRKELLGNVDELLKIFSQIKKEDSLDKLRKELIL